MKKSALFCLLVFLIVSCAKVTIKRRAPANFEGIEHVLLIGIDGFGGNYFKEEYAPNLVQLKKEGSWTLKMKNIKPAVSAPNWFSMFSGIDEEHGITKWNGDVSVYHWASTIFKLAKEQRPEKNVGVFYNWGHLANLIEKDVPDISYYNLSSKALTFEAAKFIREKKPGLTFVYYGNVDTAGHALGWGGKSYYKALKKVDDRIGYLFKKIKDSGLWDKTLIIVSADHGGEKKGHGADNPLNREIPFIIKGPYIKKDHEIKEEVSITDILPTMTYAMEIGAHRFVKGKAIKEVFEKVSEDIPTFRSNGLEKELLETSAAINWGNGKSYHFFKSDYSRHNLFDFHLEHGPTSNWNFHDLEKFKGGPADIDAAVRVTGEVAYFFKKDQYIKFNPKTGKADIGYPLTINNVSWNGLGGFKGGPTNLDAAFYYGQDMVYFFKGDEFIIFNLKSRSSSKPESIAKGFKGLESFQGGAQDLDAALDQGDGKVYFFKGNEYIRFDLKTKQSDPEYPKKIN